MCRRNKPVGIALIAGGLGLILGVFVFGGFFALLLGCAAIITGIYILAKKPC